jgi:hypothetical protein
VGDVGSVANRIELSGLARSSERSTLGFETGGRISKLHVDVEIASLADSFWLSWMFSPSNSA